jgi:NAD(P)-dependent dehydrogenase (short-subunit alcohol dehydrogenase family)
MSGKVLIYGGSGGIGAATARLLKARGYSLHLIARNEARLATLANELDAEFTVGDVRTPDTFLRASAAGRNDSRLVGLIYAVGTINLKPIARLDDEDFEQDYRINALGAVKAVQAALPGLKAGDEPSSVVLFSTVAVAQGFPSHSSISMAKGAVEGLTVALAAELSPKVRVNAIAPSLTRTSLADGLLGSEAMAKGIADMHAIPRLGTAGDIAAAATFLIADSPWITGQVIRVDGGRSTLRPRG